MEMVNQCRDRKRAGDAISIIQRGDTEGAEKTMELRVATLMGAGATA